MAEIEPQYASEYDDRTTEAVRSVLVEISQILGSRRDKNISCGQDATTELPRPSPFKT